MRANWRSSILKTPFERVVIGFDLRKENSLTALFLSSYDENSRYESFNESHGNMLSPMNLFQVDPEQKIASEIPRDARVVAFDLPSKYLRYLSRGNVSNPPIVPLGFLRRGWRFMGFDIVDPLTQSSAFHAFDSPCGLKEDGAAVDDVKRNSVGLVDDADNALRVAAFFDGLFPEHAPFVPCGIWLKDHRG